MTLPAGIPPWNCPTCNIKVDTAFCSNCGESPPRARDLTLRGLFHQVFEALSSIDSRLIRSIRCLVTRPGSLTVAYVKGQRKPYVGPIELFLIANVAFFAVQSLTSTNIFSSPLDSHLHHQDWSALARDLVTRRLETRGLTLDAYAPIFDQAVVLNAKSLIVLMVMPFALVLPLVFFRERQPFVAHAVFSLHLYAFVLLLFCVALAVAAVDVLVGGAGLGSDRVDDILSVLNLAACATYLYLAIGRVYRARGVIEVIKALFLTIAVAAIVLAYRFALFVITLYST